jgi:hypothetical protein
MVNLDCLSNEQLKVFVERIEKVPALLRKNNMRQIDNGGVLKGDVFSRMNHKIYLSNLANYASALLEARNLRLAGKIQDALELEAFCDEVYDHLPQKAKW